MSSVRVLFAEIEGPPEVIQQALSQFVERLKPTPSVPPAIEAAPVNVASPALPAPPSHREPEKRVGRPKKQVSPKRVADLDSGQAKPSPAQDAVRAVLAKGPLTSGDVLKALQPDIKAGKTTVDSVYATLGTMRKKGVIETKEDERDGLKKNYLVDPR